MIEQAGKERSVEAKEAACATRNNLDEAHFGQREEKETACSREPIIGATQQTGTALVEAGLLLLGKDANEKTSTSGTNTKPADAGAQREVATSAARGDVCLSCGEMRYNDNVDDDDDDDDDDDKEVKDDGAKREIKLIGRVDECGLMRRCAFATCNTHDERRRRREEQLRSSSNELQLEQPMQQHLAAQVGVQSKEAHLRGAHFCGAGSCGTLSVATATAQLTREPAGGNVKNGVSERLSGDLNWQSISRAEPQAASSEERAAQSVVSVQSGTPSACLASQSATLSGHTQRELEVEWTSGAEGRSLFKHALKSSLVEASCDQCKRQQAASIATYKKIQSGGEAIGRTIKNLVHQLSGGCSAAPSSRNLEDRRSTYCSSVGIVTSDLNYDSSFSSVNNCSESNNTCGAMLPQHGSSRGLNANLNQEHQQQHQQQYQTHAQQTSTTATTAISSLDRPRNFDDCGKDPSNNNNANTVGLILSNKKRKTKPVGGLKERENWDKNIEFLLAVIGFAVDLGNVWRFPYICYKNGGGAFLIPYTIMFILGGLPIFYLEMSLGQYFSSGCLTVWLRVCPMAKGIGYAMCVLNFFTGLYYNTIISWAVFFFVESFTPILPWTRCDNHWNSPGCRTIDQRQAMNASHLVSNLTMPAPISNATSLIKQNQYTTPTQDYFEREVLQIHRSSGIHDLGDIRMPLAIYLAIVFVCIYFAIWKGVKSTGKAVWITALLPYFVLIPLLIRGVFLKGAWLGIKYYLYPQWMKITDVDVWVEAAKQIYFSLGPGFGTLMALSSYNKFNHNCCRWVILQ